MGGPAACDQPPKPPRGRLIDPTGKSFRASIEVNEPRVGGDRDIASPSPPASSRWRGHPRI